MQNEKNASLKKPKKDGKTETISELAHRHLRDENHTTSDDELRNAKVEFSEQEEAPEGSLFEVDNTTLTGETTDEGAGNEDDKSDNPPNPYKVLNP